MKYLVILTIAMLTNIFAQDNFVNNYENSATGWVYEQATLQGFYMFEVLEVDGESAAGNGTSPPNAECEGDCDVLGAFIDRDGEEVCVGWTYANVDGYTTLPLMGADIIAEYLSPGEVPYIKIYDASNESILDVNPSDDLQGWQNNDIAILNGISSADNSFGCSDESACNFDGDATADDGSCTYPSGCDDQCGSDLEFDECGVCGGDGIGEGECDCEGNVFDCAGNCPSEISVTLLENENECVGDYSTSHGGTGDYVGCEDGGITFEECVQICIDNPNCNGFGFSLGWGGPNGCDPENGLGPCNPQVNNYCDGNNTWDWYGISDYQESYEDDCGTCDSNSDNDNEECTGCMNSDADNYDENAEIDSDNCEFSIPPAINLTADSGPARVFLSWDAPADDFASDAGYTYHIFDENNGGEVKTTSQTQTQITGLEADVEHCFTVLAEHNEYGNAQGYSNIACAIPFEVVGPTWRLQLEASIDSYDQFQNTGVQDWILTDEHNYLGVAPDASWGYDPVHDILEPATSPGNYISLFFDHPEWGNDQFNSHFTEDIVLDDDDFFSTNLTQWDGRVKSDVPGTTTISIHVETGQVPNNYEMYLYLKAENSDWEDAGSWHRINHEGHTDISFYMGGDGEQEFSVFIGNIVPQEPAGLEAQGHFNSIFLSWDHDGNENLSDIRERYPALTYNVYRDDEPSDPNSNEGAPGDGPGGCGGLLTDNGQGHNEYHDDASIYEDYPGEGLLQESTYNYTVTASNLAGESSEGHTIRTSGGFNTWYDGRDSRIEATTQDNASPVSVIDYVPSPNGTNEVSLYDEELDDYVFVGDWTDGIYEIPHNYNPDENRIFIEHHGYPSFDEDFPYGDAFADVVNDDDEENDNWRFQWTQVAGADDLEDISDLNKPAISFSVGNVHENGAKSYTWNLSVETDHPVRILDENQDGNLYNTCGDWQSELHTHEDNKDITITVHEEPNRDPEASSALGLIRAGDGKSVLTSDDYDESDFNDYDGNPFSGGYEEGGGAHVWYEPHDNNGDENPADLWFSADESSDPDGECEGEGGDNQDGIPECLDDCDQDDFWVAAENEDFDGLCEAILSWGECTFDCPEEVEVEEVMSECYSCFVESTFDCAELFDNDDDHDGHDDYDCDDGGEYPSEEYCESLNCDYDYHYNSITCDCHCNDEDSGDGDRSGSKIYPELFSFLNARDHGDGCDHQTYQWFATMGSSLGFDYEDLDGDGHYSFGEPYTLEMNDELVYEDVDLDDFGIFDHPGMFEISSPCNTCLPGIYGNIIENVDEEGYSPHAGDNGKYNYNGRDAHLSMYGGGDDSVIILTMVVTDVYGDSDHTSLLVAVRPERNEGPTSQAHRLQPTAGDAYYVRYGEDLRDVQVTDPCDNLGADDSDNDDLTFEWTYEGSDDIDLSQYNSSYTHAYDQDPSGWLNAYADLSVGEHSFTFTVTDPYGESASSTTDFIIREEPHAVPATVVVDSTDLKYTMLSVEDNRLADFAYDDCYGEVYNGPDFNTYKIELWNTTRDSLLETFMDPSADGSDRYEYIDQSLEAETLYEYQAIAFNSNDIIEESASSYTSTTTHDRPQVTVLTPNGVEIRSMNDLYNVKFSTTQKEYISHIEVFYLEDGDSACLDDDSCTDGTDNSNADGPDNVENCYYTTCSDGEKVHSDTGRNIEGVAAGNDTENFLISDNLGVNNNYQGINYDAKVAIRVHDVGDYNGENSQHHDDVSDDPFTMASHTLQNDYPAGWHLVGSALEPVDGDIWSDFESLGAWGNDWVAFDVSGAYDNLELNLGQGYYLAIGGENGSQTLILDGDPVTADLDCEDCQLNDNNFDDANLELDKGWNLVSNPLVNKVDKNTFIVSYEGQELEFQDAVDAGWIAPTIYGWFDNSYHGLSYSPIDRIMPFGGYFINTSRELTIQVRPHLFDDGELTRKVEDQIASTILDIRARDISGDAIGDFITIGLLETANDEFVYGEDEYDLPRQAYTSMGGEYIDMKIGSNLMKDMKSSEYEDYQAWNISISNQKVDNDIELSWGDVSSFGDNLYLVINDEPVDMLEQTSLEISNMVDEIAIVIGNIDSYLNPVPTEFGLGSAYPNPFNPVTNLELALNEDGMVNMAVYNVRGQVVDVLLSQNMKAGYHNVVWNADGISSGMYFVKVQNNTNSAIQKLMLLK